MRVERAGHVVIGYSLAGISAALTLATAGDRVVLLDFHRDTDAIAEVPRIHRTSLGPSVSGIAFEGAVQNLLEREGVERHTDCFISNVHSGEGPIVQCDDRRWSCKGVVFAPNGTEPGIDIEGSSALQGFGLSYSAAADAPFYSSRRVAVYGDAPRVIEHAWIAGRYASEVVVLMKGDFVATQMQLVDELRSTTAVTFETHVALRSLHAGSDGLLTAIDFDGASGLRSVDVSALFVAQHAVPMTDVVRGEAAAEAIAFAGLAAGISYWEHAELVDNGARAARTLLTVQQ
ncbi:MAG TPA: FAD-dependent oxidoreductase [Thermoanaerobaculia bacterium]|jgi:thioredoxin reductase